MWPSRPIVGDGSGGDGGGGASMVVLAEEDVVVLTQGTRLARNLVGRPLAVAFH